MTLNPSERVGNLRAGPSQNRGRAVAVDKSRFALVLRDPPISNDRLK
jgi:hypothetical protein